MTLHLNVISRSAFAENWLSLHRLKVIRMGVAPTREVIQDPLQKLLHVEEYYCYNHLINLYFTLWVSVAFSLSKYRHNINKQYVIKYITVIISDFPEKDSITNVEDLLDRESLCQRLSRWKCYQLSLYGRQLDGVQTSAKKGLLASRRKRLTFLIQNKHSNFSLKNYFVSYLVVALVSLLPLFWSWRPLF